MKPIAFIQEQCQREAPTSAGGNDDAVVDPTFVHVARLNNFAVDCLESEHRERAQQVVRRAVQEAEKLVPCKENGLLGKRETP
eukprot:CAMPEP_0197457722 /NCGR_PEP_ID=MMETSP1175-20131217/46874_1 /TAXON_ID=1003142 /ORGANISM="Triceratium dubium, Strain CCMP147" /LENGTH=82 /DNA_ID=CAMNT_0042992161 /DNA_START=19 /DNA_END=263 /DNA_ORIENTATION=+